MPLQQQLPLEHEVVVVVVGAVAVGVAGLVRGALVDGQAADAFQGKGGIAVNAGENIGH